MRDSRHDSETDNAPQQRRLAGLGLDRNVRTDSPAKTDPESTQAVSYGLNCKRGIANPFWRFAKALQKIRSDLEAGCLNAITFRTEAGSICRD